MTTGSFPTWLHKLRVAYVADHGVTPTECVSCGEPVTSVERVIRKSYVAEDGKQRKRLGLSDYCVACRGLRAPSREKAVSRFRQWGTFDYTTWAEAVLYPDVPYERLTWEERQHCYWLARTRWASDGLYRVLMTAKRRPIAEIERDERRRLQTLRVTLARHGRAVTFPPFTDWLDADDYADPDGRSTGTLARGRFDADPDGDGAGAEAESGSAA